MSAVVSSYTFHSATQSPAGDALETLPAFRGFERAYLQPLLQRPPSAALWLDPLLEPACALVAWLVNPSPLRSQPPILLGPDRRPGRALAAYAGPHLAAVWCPALEQARALLQARATATGKQNKKARLAAVAFPAAAQGGCCLHVAVHAVRLVPGGRRPMPRRAAPRRAAPRRPAPRRPAGFPDARCHKTTLPQPRPTLICSPARTNLHPAPSTSPAGARRAARWPEQPARGGALRAGGRGGRGGRAAGQGRDPRAEPRRGARDGVGVSGMGLGSRRTPGGSSEGVGRC